MNKVSGKQSDFAYVREDGSRIIVGYGLTKKSKSLYEWMEVYLYKKQHGPLTLKMVKDAIIGDINAQTDEQILTGFSWTPEGSETPLPVWLSMENQSNFSEAHHIAKEHPELILPVTFKIGEQEDGAPVYHTFETFSELDGFFLAGAAFKNQCLNEGWQRKDAIDWAPYEALFPEQNQEEQANADSE